MTTVIDERVVEMRFNNADFEKNVAQSMQTLDKLKQSLKFDGGAKSLEEIGKAAGGFKLSGITETISEAASKFSVMEIAGITAIAKITSAAMDMGTKLVKSLSVDQVTAGFGKYADKTTAVQTIMASTAKLYNNQDEQLRDINEQMDKLMWFTDETSYNFVDMVSNIGKFTSNNIGLEESVTAMQGIANWAAKSGQNAQTASRAMYNIAQAMGVGSMKVQDWKSIELANMATYEFKETAAETAVQLGKLRKVSDGLYETLDGKQFTLEQFREQLKSNWFDKEVMMETFAVYGRFTDVLHALSEATGENATQLLQDAEKYAKGELDIQEYSERTKVSVEDLTAAFEELNAGTNEVGRTAFKNAQEAKTFGEVIDSVKDAVSTKWSETFELLFGNYLEAKKLWTGLANDLWEVFAASGDERNEILSFWKELGGRDSLIEGVINFVNILIKPLQAIKQAFRSMFPDNEEMGNRLYNLTEKFRELGERLQPTQEMLDNIFRTFKGLFTIGQMVAKVILAIIKAIVPAAKPFGTLLDLILRVTGYIGVFIMALAEYAEEVGVFEAITAGLVTAFTFLWNAVKTVVTVVGGGLLLVITTVASVIAKIISTITNFVTKSKVITKVIDSITKAVNFLKKTFAGAEKPIEKVNAVIKKSEEYFGTAAKSGAEFGTIMKDTGDQSKKALTPLQKIGNVLKTVVSVLGLAATAVVKIIVNLGVKIKEFFESIKARFTDAGEDKNAFVIVFEELFDKIKEILGNAKEAIKEFFDNLGIDTSGVKEAFDTITNSLKSFLGEMDGGKIAAIALSIALLALVGKAIDLSSKIGALASAMSGFFTNINKILKKQFFRPVNYLTDLAKAFALVAASLALLIYVDKDKRLLEVAGIMTGLITVMTILAFVIEALSNKFTQSKELVKGFNGVSKTIIALAGAVLILSAAMSVIAQIKVDDMGEFALKLGLATGMLVVVAGIAVGMSHLIGPLARGSILILSLAVVLNSFANAMRKLADIPLATIETNARAYTVVFVGIAGMILAASKIKLTSAIGMFLLAKSLGPIFEAIGDLVKKIKENATPEMIAAAERSLDKIVVLGVALGLAVFALYRIIGKAKGPATALSKATGIFSGIGGTLAGIGVAAYLITKSIAKLHDIFQELQPGELESIAKSINRIIITLGVFTILVGAVSWFVNRINQGYDHQAEIAFVKIGVMLVALSVAVRIMASAVKTLAGIQDKGGLLPAIGIIAALGAVLAIIVGVSGTVQKAIPAMAALIAATVAIGILIGELAILGLMVGEWKDPKTLNKAILIMGGFFVGLWAIIRVLDKLSNVKPSAIFGVATLVGVLGGIMIALAVISKEDLGNSVFAAGASLALAFAMLALVFKTIGDMDVPSVKKIITIVAATAPIAAIGASLYNVAKQPWSSILAAGGMIVAALAVVVGILIALDKIGSQGGNVTAAASIMLLSASMVAVAHAISVLDGVEWGAVGKFAAAIGIMAGIITIMGVIGSKFALFDVVIIGIAASFILVAASFIGIALAFRIFADALPVLASGLDILTPSLVNFAENVPFLLLVAGMYKMAEGLAVLGAAGLVFGIGAIGLLGLGAALGLLGLVAPLAAAGFAQLQDINLIGIAEGLMALGLTGAILGLFTPLILVAAVAIGLFGASLLILKAGLDAVDGAFAAFTDGIASSVDTVVTKIKEIPTALSGLFSDISSAFSGSAAAGCIQAAVDLGLKIAGGKHPDTGFIGGLAAALGWHSEPDVIEDLMTDVSSGLQNNSAAVSAAQTSGAQIGNSFGSSFFDSASKWFSNLGANVSTWWSGVKASFSGGSTQIQNDLGTAGAATEKFGKTTEDATQKSESGWDKVTNGVKKFTDPIVEKLNAKLEETTGGLFEGADATNYLTETVEEMTDSMKEATGGAGDMGEALDGAGKKGKSAAENMKSLRDTLAGQLDMFSKFEIKTGVTAENMLENMRSNIDGFASWSHRMAVLAERFAEAGIDRGLYEKLEEMGPKGYETMNAFYEMSEEQLAQVKELWATGLTLPDSQADIVNSGFQYMGEMAAQGFSDALNDHKAAHAAAHGLGDAALDGLRESLDVHSPSQKTFKIGVFLVDGLGLGMTSNSALAMLELCITQVTTKVMELFNENLSPETMSTVGEGMLENLFSNALGNMATADNPIISAFAKSLMQIGPVLDALKSFVESVLTEVNSAFGMADSNGSSEVFYGYGKGSVDGFTKGISNNLGYIHTQIMIMGIKVVGWLNNEKFADKFYQAGKNATVGFAEGLSDTKAAEKVMKNAQEVADAARKAMEKALDEESPSKVTRRIGEYASLGLAIGITDAAGNVEKAASSVAEGAADSMMDANGRIQDVLNSELDLNPIITPMLDLSVMRAQLAGLNEMMGNPAYGINGQNVGRFTTNATPQINFTQNNYSPKELSRIDIYRQTKNQISMIKGVKGVVANA